ncbi:MAG TPA: STAS domain-containing protein [Spirochaetota bacterium]|nr:STAS domain-containing protein [Spirochaetota bacterium]HPJ33442.1 STAS domain-containing protein [Spirochaetota bacterium]
MYYFLKNSNITIKTGESLTVNEIEHAWQCFESGLKHYPAMVIIDFSELSSIDSAGIGFLVKIQKKTKIYCVNLVLTGMSDSLKRLFSITGILPFFKILTEEELRLFSHECVLY